MYWCLHRLCLVKFVCENERIGTLKGHATCEIHPRMGNAISQKGCFNSLLLSARTAMWSMPVVLTESENKNDSVKMTLQK